MSIVLSYRDSYVVPGSCSVMRYAWDVIQGSRGQSLNVFFPFTQCN